MSQTQREGQGDRGMFENEGQRARVTMCMRFVMCFVYGRDAYVHS